MAFVNLFNCRDMLWEHVWIRMELISGSCILAIVQRVVCFALTSNLGMMLWPAKELNLVLIHRKSSDVPRVVGLSIDGHLIALVLILSLLIVFIHHVGSSSLAAFWSILKFVHNVNWRLGPRPIGLRMHQLVLRIQKLCFIGNIASICCGHSLYLGCHVWTWTLRTIFEKIIVHFDAFVTLALGHTSFFAFSAFFRLIAYFAKANLLLLLVLTTASRADGCCRVS